MTTQNQGDELPADRSLYSRKILIAIYEQYSEELYRYAYRMLVDSDLAEDCVSETFSRFLRAVRDGLGPVENVRAYLYRIAHNWITDHFRRQPIPLLSLDSERHEEPDANPSSVVAVQFERERIRKALLMLPPEQRQVIELRFLENWAHKDVAAALGKSEEATRALQHRALIALKRLLIKEE
ncbi:MAG: sigma-70 family RNA polymerase sigma factor [Anaerolineales bacterium]|jgi:RNA polymerase sigma-70 factor (ECF subfamily)|nr:sigma-70 family RNA polymerase sigma factor [Anaerolineales bacterium]